MIERRIDLKHHITASGKLMKSELGSDGEPTGNGQEIPLDEPTILFRGRDKLAVSMLKNYRQLCKNAGANEFQLGQVNALIERFQAYADASHTMKMPGTTQGKL